MMERNKVAKFSYNKLFKLLIDKKLKKKDLVKGCGISHTTLVKLKNGGNVNTEKIAIICDFLKCQPNDIMELVDDD